MTKLFIFKEIEGRPRVFSESSPSNKIPFSINSLVILVILAGVNLVIFEISALETPGLFFSIFIMLYMLIFL